MPSRSVLHRSLRALPLAPPEGPIYLVDSTLNLLQRARAGDADALDALIGRFLPRLQRWATGRLPGWARDLADTHDLVQEDRKSTRLNSSHLVISYAVFCLKKKN